MMGVVLYMSGSTRPDIDCYVHQCASLSHNPKHSHEIELKHITRYLKGNRNKGYIVKPTSDELRFGVFTDTNFAVLFITYDKVDNLTAKSYNSILPNFDGVHML